MRKIFVCMLLLLMLLCFAGCKQTEEPLAQIAPSAAPTEPEPNAVQQYLNAVPALDSASLEVSQNRTVSAGTGVFLETMEYDLIYKNLNTDDVRIAVEGTVDYDGAYEVSFEEGYLDGVVYGSIQEATYKVEETADAFFDRYVPIALLTVELYDNVTIDDDYLVSFSGARELEPWLASDGYVLRSASGTAQIGASGRIQNYTYQASYSHGEAVIDLDISVAISKSDATIPAPDKYLPRIDILNPEIPMLMERAHGFLLQSDSLTMGMEEMILSDAFYAVYTSSTQYNEIRGDKDYLGTTSVYQFADLDGGNVEESVSQVQYCDGVLRLTDDGEESSVEMDLDLESEALVELRDAYYPDIRQMEEMGVTELPGGYVIDYNFAGSYEYELRLNTVGAVAEDPYLLEDMSSTYTPVLAEGYLAIDKYSGLPTALCINYTGVHTIEETECGLSYQIWCSFDGVSLSAYHNITGKLLPGDEHTESPTPAFYKVTGPEGQQMWLLGTIHVGDARTLAMPDQIHTAFRESDALAVEFDMNDFEDQLLESPELAEEALRAYVYTDGSTVESHLTLPDLYPMALQTMKMTGQMSTVMTVTKPIIWSDIIDDFFMRQGYRYSTLYGVDMQLLDMAQAQEKKILNIESGMQQLNLLTGYSDEVQEMILAGSLSVDPITYNQQLNELFELWCSGDEEAIREYLTVDTSEMTEEELRMYMEYEQAMSTDRNAQMLEVARGYLESGETVFYAVGLAHLLEEDGLVNTLREAGYIVEKITY